MPRGLTTVVIQTPKAIDDFLFAHDHVRPGEALGERGEFLCRWIRSRFNEDRVTNQRDTEKLS